VVFPESPHICAHISPASKVENLIPEQYICC